MELVFIQNAIGKFLIDINDLIQKELYVTGNWEEYQDEYYKKYITADMDVIDCGAHVGVTTIKMSKLARKVYSFEPLLLNFQQLVLNINENKLTNVVPYHVGLSDRRKISHYAWVNQFNRGASGLEVSRSIEEDCVQLMMNNTRKEQKQMVYLLPLDDLELNVGFIKIDTEGCEFDILRGARNTIIKYKPVILFECVDNVSDIKNLLLEYNTDYIVEPIGKSDYIAYINK